MRILDRFFRKPRAQSPLKTFLCALSFEQSAKTYHSVSDPALRLPAALSVWALHLAHRFAEGLHEMVQALDRSSAAQLDSAYDRVASEAVALVHYWLVRDFLAANEIDDDDHPFFEVLKDAMQLSNSLLTKEAPAVVPEDWLLNRTMRYSHSETFKSNPVHEQFISHIVDVVNKVSDKQLALPAQLALATYYPIFVSTHLEQFKKTAKAMYLAHQEGAL